MSLLTYQCDGCGTTTDHHSPVGWRTVSPIGLDRQRFANVPVQSHLCGVCWELVMRVVHSRLLTAESQRIPSRTDTADIRVIEGSWDATT